MNPTLITIWFILISALTAVIMRKVKKDKCLKDFRNNVVTVELLNGKKPQGELKLKSTGFKLNYQQRIVEEPNRPVLSFLLYKNEYPDIQAIVRYYRDLREKNLKERELDFRKTFHPGRSRRALRSFTNLLKIIKDSVVEILNLLTNHMSKTTPAGITMSGQQGQISKMQNELYGVFETSYEPLLEDYIGQRVLLELKEGDRWAKYRGVLKDYTAEFIEIIDVEEYGAEKLKVDLIVLRKYGIVRHLSE